MSIYVAPVKHNGTLNSIFNATDYAQSASGSTPSQALNDARYLKNTGIVVSSASTTFNNTVTIAAQTNVSNLSVSGLLCAKQNTDSLVSATFAAAQSYSFNNGMVYTLTSNSTATTTLAINDIPTTPQQSYIFTFIIQPTTANSSWYIVPNTNFISVNGGSAPLYGLQNAVLPRAFTYIVQQVTVINTSTTTSPTFITFTSVSGY